MGAPTAHLEEEEEEEGGEEGNGNEAGGPGAAGVGGGSLGSAVTDDADLLGEILGRLDGRSLAAAACVCRAWRAAAGSDRVWESLCLRHHHRQQHQHASPASSVVAALGGYRALYRLCVGPALHRLAAGPDSPDLSLALSLSLSLFSIDRFERLGGGGPHRPASLLFLCSTPLDVSS